MSKRIAYEPHPVTPERKAELVGQGYKIMDIAFKPADAPAAPKAAPVEPVEVMTQISVAPVEPVDVEAPQPSKPTNYNYDAPKRGRPAKVK